MAQQITNNSLILDMDNFSVNQNDYTDDSLVKFESVLNIANKTLNENSNFKNYDNETNTNKVADNYNFVSKHEQKNTKLTASDSINKTDYSSVNNNETSKTSELPTNANSKEIINDKSNNSEPTEDLTNDTKNTDEVINITSQYVYLQEENNIDSIDNIEIEDNTSDIDIDIDINVDILDETSDFSKEIPEIDTNLSTINEENTNIINLQEGLTTEENSVVIPLNVNTENTNTAPVLNAQNTENTNTAPALNAQNTENVNVLANSSINENIQIQKNENLNSKDLISQKMIDELNITIEEVSDTTIAENTVDESTSIMDSTEQAIKYMMDKETDNTNVEIDNRNTIKEQQILKHVENNNSNDKNIEIETANVKTLEIVEETEEIVVDNGNENVEILDENSSNDIETIETEDVYQAQSDTNENQENDLTQNQNNDKSDSKNTEHHSKKEAFVSDKTFEETIDADFETTSNETKLTASIEHVSGNKGDIDISSTTKSTTPNNAPVNISKEDVIAQIHTKLQSMNTTTNSKLTMILNPESLGKVAIQLVNTKTGLTAEMQVVSQAVKDILDSNLSNLKDTLTAQGIQVNEVSIKVSQSENNAEMDYTEQEGNNENKQNQNKQQEQEKDAEKFEQMFSNSKENNKKDLEE